MTAIGVNAYADEGNSAHADHAAEHAAVKDGNHATHDAPAHERHDPATGHGDGAHGDGAHGDGAHGDGAHGSSAHGEQEAPPTFSDINWYYGFFGEEEGAEPSFAVRPKGMGTPFLATLFNWSILVGLIYVLARKQLPIALAKRKAQIVQGMEEAGKMLAESKARLAELDEKLAKTDSEIERIKGEMARAGELERERILAEAVERRVRMERDAHQLIETELEAAHESLRKFVVEQALANAKSQMSKQLKPEDQQRLFEESLQSLKKLPARSLGGQS
jgi:F-type H+-transporting ATPase subunit b